MSWDGVRCVLLNSNHVNQYLYRVGMNTNGWIISTPILEAKIVNIFDRLVVQFDTGISLWDNKSKYSSLLSVDQ